jgi:hypothetical protein
LNLDIIHNCLLQPENIARIPFPHGHASGLHQSIFCAAFGIISLNYIRIKLAASLKRLSCNAVLDFESHCNHCFATRKALLRFFSQVVLLGAKKLALRPDLAIY